MPDRYYSAEPIQPPTTTLTGSEAHHLLHVMRAQRGLQIVLFDGRGGEYPAEVVRCDRATVELSVGLRHDVDRELPFELTLAVALPKGDRQRWLIEKAVELGVSRLVPLQTARGVRDGGEPSEKLSRYVIEASKQCGRNRLMDLGAPVDLLELAEATSLARRILAHPGGEPFAALALEPAADLWIAVGPEGGFTDDEVDQSIEAGWETVNLGSRILRVETAAIALVAAATVR